MSRTLRLPLRLCLAATAALLACNTDIPPEVAPMVPPPSDPLARKAVVLSTDYMTGTYAVVDLDARTAERNVGMVHSDPVGRIRGRTVYVVNRLFADNVQVLDPAQRFRTERQFSVGNATNPNDLAFLADDKIYVSLYDRAQLGIFDPKTGMAKGTIDLAAFADADGIPEAGSMVLVGRRAFVAVQRLDRNTTWAPTRAGELVVIDADRDSVIDLDPAQPGPQGVTLRGANPSGLRLLPGNLLYLATAGDYFQVDAGGIERVRTEPPYSSEWVIEESRLEGSITGFATQDGNTFYLVVSRPTPGGSGSYTVLFRYRASTDELRELARTAGFDLAGLALTSRGEVLVCDRTMTRPGLRIFDGENATELTSGGPIDVGLPPSVVLAFDDATVVLP